jgi:ketosteroid isomerase-like protein
MLQSWVCNGKLRERIVYERVCSLHRGILMDEEFAALEESFNKAIMENDAEVIAHFLADDWIIVDPNGGLIDRDRFLGVIRSGVLSHDLMKSEEMRCRFYGDTGLVTAITISKGTLRATNSRPETAAPTTSLPFECSRVGQRCPKPANTLKNDACHPDIFCGRAASIRFARKVIR